MENQYSLQFNQLFGFVLVNNRTREEVPLSDKEAFKWSKKSYVAVNLQAEKKMDEILGLYFGSLIIRFHPSTRWHQHCPSVSSLYKMSSPFFHYLVVNPLVWR